MEFCFIDVLSKDICELLAFPADDLFLLLVSHLSEACSTSLSFVLGVFVNSIGVRLPRSI
jgi:hypothetical protein